MLFRAFQAVIILRFPFPDWDKLKFLTKSVGKRAAEAFNYTFSADEYVREFVDYKTWYYHLIRLMHFDLHRA